jgi:dipeptidyl aminopeptidase/acylaminoacyl peptidase
MAIVNRSLYVKFATLSSCFACTFAMAVTPRPLRPADAVATTRFMAADADGDSRISISPDRQRYVIRLARGDVERNGLHVDVMSGLLTTYEGVMRLTRIATLFSTGLGSPGNGGADTDGFGRMSPIHWVKNDSIAFLFSNEEGVRQVVLVNLRERQVKFLTQHPAHIRAFSIASDQTVVYLAEAMSKRPTRSGPPRSGFVVPDTSDAVSLAEGYFDGSNTFSRSWDSEWFIQRPQTAPINFRVAGAVIDPGYPDFRDISLSHSGERAVILGPAVAVAPEWDNYEGSDLRKALEAARRNPNSVARREVQQLHLLDTRTGRTEPLWNAPAPRDRFLASWSPDDRLLALASVPLPLSGSRSTLSGTVMFDLHTGRYSELPVHGKSVRSVKWIGNVGVEFQTQSSGDQSVTKRFNKVDNQWQLVGSPVPDSLSNVPRYSVRIREQIDAPPKLFAVDRDDGLESLVWDPNPGLLDRFKLGRVTLRNGRLRSGERWSGLLVLPAEYQQGRRYPLVIQSQYSLPLTSEFTLYGWALDNGLGPSSVASYAAQSLAGRGLAVLQLNVDGANNIGTPGEVLTYQRAYEEVSEELVAEGLVARDCVGLSGFSRNGYFVGYALSHSDFPFAAAVITDNYDPSYIQTTLIDGYTAAEATIGAPVFGSGLQAWLERAPGFNADKIRTPVRFVGQSRGIREYVLWQWETFARLRHMDRAVEMYVMPDSDAHPSHSPQNPAQILAVQESTIDWFDFWLRYHEDAAPAKATQYERWRVLRHKIGLSSDSE